MRTKDQMIKELSDALLKVRPLGGSELFIKFEDRYVADPLYCGNEIDRLRRENHELKVERALQNKKK